MSEPVLQTLALTKEYEHTKALHNVSLRLNAGHLYGFVGRNGAGKTTLFRLVAGLVFPTGGTFSLFGKTGEKELAEARKRMGSTIETPVLYGDMTAYQNLEVQQIGHGIPDKGIITQTLDLVGLSDTGTKRAKHFSLGMKQRLAIGIALLNEPEFLMLDEPINGLDPMGIKEVRELLVRLNKERNITMLISSHILSELYQMATDYIIIDNGQIVEELTHDLLDQKCRRHISLKTNDIHQAAVILENILHTTDFQVMPDNSIKLYAFLDDTERVAAALAEKRLIVSKMAVEGDSLENYFVNLVGGGRND